MTKKYVNADGSPKPVSHRGKPVGRPPGKQKPRSTLRKTQKALEDLEPKALENIKRSVEGQEVDKEVIATSKWVVNTKISISKAATAEELAEHGIKGDLENSRTDIIEEELEEEEDTSRAVFSMNVVNMPTKKDL
tara:strand:+ start:19070 stop:19474 length:405 start_codon:yes stop_codon:yes gene_type:complete